MNGARPRRRTAAGIVWEPRRERIDALGSAASLGYYGHGPVGRESARIWQPRLDGPWHCSLAGVASITRHPSFSAAAEHAAQYIAPGGAGEDCVGN